MSTVSAMAWLVQHVPVSTATLAAIFGRGLQETVWRDLAERGPATVHELTDRLGEDHQRVRNTLYRLASVRAVRCMTRMPSPVGASRPRVVWAAIDRDGRIVSQDAATSAHSQPVVVQAGVFGYARDGTAAHAAR